MDIITKHKCDSWNPYHTMYVGSESKPDVAYMILVPVPGDPPEEWICSCPSWRYRGTCKHLSRVSPCYWQEGDEEEQTQEGVCPRCSIPTHKELELIDE